MTALSKDLQIQADGSICVPKTNNTGLLGEAIAAQWLSLNDWQVLYHRWHCRWGEIDLVVRQPSNPLNQSSGEHTDRAQRLNAEEEHTLVFVEVKTRSLKNWDADGLMAITPEKQHKLWKTAELFLASYPEYAVCPCRFDLILIQHRRSPVTRRHNLSNQAENDRTQLLPSLAKLRSNRHSAWISLGNNAFRVNNHLQNIFEQ